MFAEIRQPTAGQYLLIPRTTSENRIYIPIGFFNYDQIALDTCQIIPNATLYHLGILTSPKCTWPGCAPLLVGSKAAIATAKISSTVTSSGPKLASSKKGSVPVSPSCALTPVLNSQTVHCRPPTTPHYAAGPGKPTALSTAPSTNSTANPASTPTPIASRICLNYTK